MLRPILYCIAFFFCASGLAAQDRTNTILVLDGSGSMWGQIDGVAKITIAQEVVAGLLADFPSDQNLGLTVYGHRSRGECTDIETIVAPGPDTRDAIAAAVAGIKPLGKTPMTDAVIAAAGALRYTEDKATVILVSDGVETCNPDPCAAARALEEAGIDFTAHVIGFDVGNDATALAQMQCLAEETGGRFLTAANAAELSAALTTVAAAEPEPVMVSLLLRAVEGDENGSEITDPVIWTLSGSDGAVFADREGNPIEDSVTQGSYTATAYRLMTETEAQVQIVTGDSGPVVATVVFPVPVPEASVSAPASAPAGSRIEVSWTGPNDPSDNIQIRPVGEDGRYLSYAYTTDGNPLMLQLPADPGQYEIRYRHKDTDTIAVALIDVTPALLSLTAPDSGAAGSQIEVGWEGPDAASDNIQIGSVGGTDYSDYAYTAEGNPVRLQLPAEAGDYELRYVFQDRQIILTRPFSVTEAEVSLSAPDSVPAGSEVEITWSGPAAPSDNVQFAQIGGSYVTYSYVTAGEPVVIVTAPNEPGDYELRYSFQDRQTIATRPITVTAVEASVSGPAEAPVGATVDIGWSGPDYPGDYVSVGAPGDDSYETYAYTASGAPARMELPSVPGSYEVKYHNSDGSVIARAPITLTEVTAQLVMQGPFKAGETTYVGWDLSGGSADFIGIGLPGDDAYLTYAYVGSGNPAQIQLPDTPGEYEVRYYLNRDYRIVGRLAITVE